MKVRTLALVPVASLALLAGCSGHQGMGMGGSSGMTRSGSGMGMSGDHQSQMCGMYRQMMAGKTPAEQQAAVEAHMRSMHGGTVTPEQVRMHREMMEKNCADGSGTR